MVVCVGGGGGDNQASYLTLFMVLSRVIGSSFLMYEPPFFVVESNEMLREAHLSSRPY